MKRRTQTDWRVLIEQQAKSRLSVAEFCQQHNLGQTYFYKRKSDLNRLSTDKPNSSFIQVNRAKPTVAPNDLIKILHHKTRLSVPVNVSPTWLAQLIKSLA
jgi:hypothetical protein